MSYTNLATQKILNNVESYGSTQNFGDGIPYLKFAWEVTFSQAEEAGQGANSPTTAIPNNAQTQVQKYLPGISTGDLGLNTNTATPATPNATPPSTGEQGLQSSPTVIAKTCELPRWSTDTQIVNVYNHKTLVQTKLTYEPITITFYDQAGGGVEKLIWTHVRGQFDGSDGSKAPKKSPLTITIKMKNLSQGADKVYTLKNAYITDAQHDTLDYSASDAVLWTITVRYEDLDTAEFSGPTPTVTTGVKKKPKKVNPPPVKTPPKVAPPDAVASQEALPYADPMGTTDPAIIMWASKPSGGFNWPWNKQAIPASTTAVSPSTGTSAKANNNVQPTSALSSQQQSTLARIQASESFKASSPAWRDAFVANYSMDPPTSHNPFEIIRASNAAKRAADAKTTRYTSFASPADSGVQGSVRTARGNEPSPPVVRDGATIVNPKTNDAKGTIIANTQEERERSVQSAQRVNDRIAADAAFKHGKLTPAQKTEYFQTGRVSSIKGDSANGLRNWDKGNF
ncbi:hypothetical protein UFOVP71_41 [uncultured Caudovirales phage]|uniref:Uncharacterized protein n=1 Tax=uncultured Caudovirales phage TaxID=2100421 RepID=A0A6J5T9P1_9CAUD|nr:hypothetical protein UFOVP71_41 [uncultured Caudovirales phage]